MIGLDIGKNAGEQMVSGVCKRIPVLHLLRAVVVQVSLTPAHTTRPHAPYKQALEKRQGTKSRASSLL
jgi:hypothetical protein